jgi:hypothetical protein
VCYRSDTIIFHMCWYRVLVNQRFPRFFFLDLSEMFIYANGWDIELEHKKINSYLQASLYYFLFISLFFDTVEKKWSLLYMSNKILFLIYSTYGKKIRVKAHLYYFDFPCDFAKLDRLISWCIGERIVT